MSVEDSLSENNPAMDEQKKAGARKKAKKMDKTNLVPPGAPAEEGDKGPDSESGEASDNAFVTVVMKKIRAYRKKLERAKALEAQEQAGKALVEDQKVLLANKTSIEKMLKELEGIKQQMVEVAKEEVKARRMSELVPDHEEAPGAVDVPDSPASRSVETIENETQTVEVEGEPVPKPEPEVVKVEVPVPVPTDPTEHVDRLLRLLHVYGRTHELKTPFTELHGVDLLAKTILGQTSPIESDFEQTLAQSVKRAVYYLNTDVREFTNGVTYEQMEVRVNELAATLQGPATEAMDNKGNEEREYHHIIFGTVDGAARPQEPSGQQPGFGTEHIVANPFESQWTGDLSSPITTPSLNDQARELPAPQASLQQLLQLPSAPVPQDRDQHELQQQQQQEPEAAEVLGNGVSPQDSSGDDQAQDQQQQVKAKGERRGENGSGRERGGRGSSGRTRRPRTGQQSREGRGSSGSGDGEGRPYPDQQQQRDQPRQPRPQPRQQQQQQHGGESTRANGGTQERYQRSGSKGEGGGRAGGVRGGGSGASRGGGGSGSGGRAGRPRVERSGGRAPPQQQHQQHGEAARSN